MPKAERMPFLNTSKMEDDHLKVLDWLSDWENSTPETDWREVGPEDYKFYAGDQDTAAVKQLLTDQKRPITVFNEIKPKIDMLIGLAAQTRFQPDVVPVGTEDEALAQLIKGTLYHYAKKTKLVRKEVECFEHSTKSGRSLLYFYIDKENPFKPKIMNKRIQGASFILDPLSFEYDMSDARAIFIDKWMSEEDLKANWPKVNTEMIKSHSAFAGQQAGYPSFWNEQDDLYRVVECWYRKYEPMVWFTNPLTGKEESLSPSDFSKFSAVLSQGLPQPDGSRGQPMEPPDFITSMVRKVYYMIFTDIFKIEGGPSPYKWKGFPAILFGAYKNDNTNSWFGAIKMMKDPQRSMNTMRRQLSHLLQTLPKGMMKHEVGSIINLEEYEKKSADPSFHLEIAKGQFDKVDFVTQPGISPIYNQYDLVMAQSMKDSSGVQDDLMGIQNTSREPGVTVQMRQQTGLAVLYVLFDNFRESRLEAGRILLSMIQQYVSQAELIRIQGQEGMQLLQINTQTNPQSPDFNDVSVGEYDLEVEETVENATMRLAIAQMLTEFSQNNPGSIPPDIVLDYANLPFTVKQRVKETTAQMQQQEQANIEAERALKVQEMTTKVNLELTKMKMDQQLELQKLGIEGAKAAKEVEMEVQKLEAEINADQQLMRAEVGMKKEVQNAELGMSEETHDQELRQAEEKHKLDMKMAQEKTAASVEAAKQKASIAKTKEKSNGSKSSNSK
jgi:hypothetical protein